MCHWIKPDTLDCKSAALACERIRHTFVKAFNEYGGSETEDDLEDKDYVQFAGVTTELEEEQVHEELSSFLPPHHRCATHAVKFNCHN